MDQDENHPQTRQQSSIKFPYYDMVAALEVIRPVRERGAGVCNFAQLAAWNGVGTTNGSFRVKYAAAQIYEFINVDKGNIELTDIGSNALDGLSNQPFVESFLNVELFKKMYGQLQGRKLPPNEALETLANRLGVPIKQAKSARRAFVKSAEHSGFIDQETGFLVKPVVQPEQNTEPSSVVMDAGKPQSIVGHVDSRYSRLDPTLLGLIDRLPDMGHPWEPEKRSDWLRVFGEVLAFVYEEPMKEVNVSKISSSETVDIRQTGIPRSIDNEDTTL